MTNESDRQKLVDEKFRKKTAQALHDGILKVLFAMEIKHKANKKYPAL